MKSSRERVRIDDGWRFSLDVPGSEAFTDPEFDDSTWREVHLPHDYVVEGPFDPGGNESHGFRPTPVGWYRRTIGSGRGRNRTWIEFDGIYRDSTIWINGKLAGRHESGYTSFYLDVTEHLLAGQDNVVAVRVDPSKDEGWWYEGGGIYRHAWLTRLSLIHVGHWGIFVRTPEITAESAAVQVEIEIENESGAAPRISIDNIVSFGSEQVARDEAALVCSSGLNRLNVELRVPNPNLWSINSPNLYSLVTVLRVEGQEVDRCETPFGIRSIRFDPNEGFFLNGEVVKIKGTANHQDFAAVGIAMTDNLQVERIRALKAMGSNAYRSAHHPPTSELLDACDQLGMLVLDENRHPSNDFEAKAKPGSTYSDTSELDSLIRRDRNHPSVIAWCLCNEEWELQTTEEGVRMLSALAERAKALDPTRPTTLALGGKAQVASSPCLRDTVEITGANYWLETYDEFRMVFPAAPFWATEFSAQLSTRGVYKHDPAKGHMASYPDALTGRFVWMQPQDISWEAIASRPFVAGGFVWAGFDYRGEPTPWQWPYCWPDVVCSWGQMDLCGFPKDAYYYFKAWWGPADEPVAHLFPHWNWEGQEGRAIRVCAYTNADESELYLNGQLVGPRLAVPKFRHVEWLVAYEPGVLELKGFRRGEPFGYHEVRTTGPAAGIVLEHETSAGSHDPEDLICVSARVVDSQGLPVPTACDELRFSVSGEAMIVGAGNGNPSDHDAESTAGTSCRTFTRRAFNGLALVVLRSTGRSGTCEVLAESRGLTPGRLEVTYR